MAIVDEQIQQLEAAWPGTTHAPLPSGASLIKIPELKLPPGWSRASSAIRFLAPIGYPHAKPDCFWADHGLRLANGAMPNAANENNPIPEAPSEPMGLWFSWHVAQWNPNRDTLLTFLNVIQDRFRKAQ
jgi:hypothetical protein